MKRRSRKIWICNDVWMHILPFFCRPQLGLTMAPLSPRFDALVDKHFEGKTTKLTLWRAITIRKDNMDMMPKLYVDGNAKGFPMPDRLLPNKIRFRRLKIVYIDHSVIAFLRLNQQIWDSKGTNLDLNVWTYRKDDVQPICDVFVRQIWPIFAANIRHLGFTVGQRLSITGGHHLDNLHGRRISRPIYDINLYTPRRCRNAVDIEERERINNYIKAAFSRATAASSSAVSYKIDFDDACGVSTTTTPPIMLFDLVNERMTKEKLAQLKDKEAICWLLKRCPIIGKTATAAVQKKPKKDENSDNNLNNVIFDLNDCSIGPLYEIVLSRIAGPSSDSVD